MTRSGGAAQLGRDLGGLGVPAVLAVELALDAADAAQLLHEVDGEPDGAGLVRDGAGDGLPDPPGGVRGELEALGVVELLDGADQAGVPLLDEVEQGEAAAWVAAGHGDDEAEVGPDEDVLGPLPLGDEGFQLLAGSSGGVAVDLAVEDLPGVDTGLDGLGQLHFLRGVQQRCAGDLVEIHAHKVAVGDLAGRADAACRAGLAGGGGLTTGDGTGCHACSLAMSGGRPGGLHIRRPGCGIRRNQRLQSGQNSPPAHCFSGSCSTLSGHRRGG
ncbi:hypothetical protein SFR_2708 [Streptomyces sp. FR-008]|nr:hypothetical protein SFR_2708 [Streptomyces sp. FR-008]